FKGDCMQRQYLVRRLVILLTALHATSSLAATPSFQGLGDLPGGSFLSLGFGLSGDGTAAVGESSSTPGTQAFRWTAAGGMLGLGDLAGGSFSSSASAASLDGSVVVGFGRVLPGPQAMRWTQAGGMVGLGDLPGG